MIEVSKFRGYDQPILKLYNEIGRLGWSVQKVDFKNGVYECDVKSPNGRKITRTGPDPATAVGNCLLYITRAQYGVTAAQIKLGMWDYNHWYPNLEPMARAYADAPVYDPKAAQAWMELAHDSDYRAQVLRNQLKIEIVNDPEPYKSAQEMCNDVTQNKHFFVSRANSEHPLWTEEQNINFRIVHDILGHCVAGSNFDWLGETKACSAHMPLLSPNAQKALATECLHQTAYGAYYRNFGPQKVAIIPQFIEPVQQKENPAAYTGVHPSQSLAPTSTPQIAPANYDDAGALPKGTQAPHETGEYGTWSKTAQSLTSDINQNWSSGVQPIPYEQGGNAFEHGGDPLDAFKPGGMMDTASKIDTGWASQTLENGDPNVAQMKQAIVNAFRVVLLSPRKDLRGNAIHYQDISNVPANESDPKTYWDTLEAARRKWNTSRGYEADSHMIWYKPLERFRQIIRTKHPELDHDQVIRLADETFYEWRMEEEHRIAAEDAQRPEDKRRSTDEIERRANESVAKRLKIYNADNDPKNDQISLLSQQESLINVPQQQQPDTSKYVAFMGTHLKSIAQISQHVDEILESALQDVAKGGQGHIFRAKVLSLGISGVGPKVASFAWLLLQPLTSQLATIDVHMMRALNHDYEKEMNPRDYFKFERELAARRDASGYGNVPLGAFQWGTWDAQRSGMGSHQDHSAMRVLNPVSHDQIDWAGHGAHIQGSTLDQQPWWQATQPAADTVAREWDEKVAPNFPQNQIPMLPNDEFQKAAGWKFSDSAFVGAIPWFTHPQTGNRVSGDPGQTIMAHARNQFGWTTPMVWAMIDEAGKDQPSQ